MNRVMIVIGLHLSVARPPAAPRRSEKSAEDAAFLLHCGRASLLARPPHSFYTAVTRRPETLARGIRPLARIFHRRSAAPPIRSLWRLDAPATAGGQKCGLELNIMPTPEM
jgi:hypothetical protein